MEMSSFSYILVRVHDAVLGERQELAKHHSGNEKGLFFS